ADYPFTTLVPNLGVVSVGTEASFVVADIPGLVTGASEGVGLGLQFLKHVERCSFLLHLVSVMEIGEALEDPLERYTALCGELESFSEELAARDQIVVLTKADLLDVEEIQEISDRFEQLLGHPPLVLSSVTGRGVDLLVQACGERLRSMLEESEGSDDEHSG
ncbi:MAG: GTPase, partial [Myxococcota bacterium]|nr:GTPase [Myxococcota bacterium]